MRMPGGVGRGRIAKTRRAAGCALVGALVVGSIVTGGPAQGRHSMGLVSVSSSGGQGNDPSFAPAISADGRYVAFRSHADNLVSGDSNKGSDIFVRDREDGTTTRVSVSSSGEEASSGAFAARPSISEGGRYVAFHSGASNLVPDDTNGVRDAFVRDRERSVTERVSLSSSGEQGDEGSGQPVVSADGRLVAFHSGASNLVPGDTNICGTVPCWDVFLRDRSAGTTERVSVSSSGAEADGYSTDPAISGDGSRIAFESGAANLVSADSNGVRDVFVADTETGTTKRVSVSSFGEEANGPSKDPAISRDGRFVAFESDASNLVHGDENGARDVFLRDLDDETTIRVSVDPSGRDANGWSVDPSLSADGGLVAFGSEASDLVDGDTNGRMDVFLRDVREETTIRLSDPVQQGEPDGRSGLYPVLSADGRWAAFPSKATNLVPDDTNAERDVFAVDTQSDAQPPSSSFTTQDGAILLAAPAVGDEVRGVAEDDAGGSGVASVEVTFSSPVWGVQAEKAELTCSGSPISCTWSVDLEPFGLQPGRYTLFVQATDAFGNEEPPPLESIRVTVL